MKTLDGDLTFSQEVNEVFYILANLLLESLMSTSGIIFPVGFRPLRTGTATQEPKYRVGFLPDGNKHSKNRKEIKTICTNMTSDDKGQIGARHCDSCNSLGNSLKIMTQPYPPLPEYI